MAAMALRFRPHYPSIRSHYFPLPYSYSSSSEAPPPPPPPPPNDGESKPLIKEDNQQDSSSSSSSSSYSSLFSDIKARLRQSQPPSRRPIQSSPSYPPPSDSPPQVATLDEIRKNLAEFRRRSAPPNPSAKPSFSPPISFQDLYNNNVASKSPDVDKEREASFDAIRESLRRIPKTTAGPPTRGQGGQPFDSSVLGSLRDRLKETSPSAGFTGPSMFAKETEKKESESSTYHTEFVRQYSHKELGEKLRSLRPEGAEGKEDWFSLNELNERLRKLRETEVKENESRIKGLTFSDLRESLLKLQEVEANKRKPSVSGSSILLGFGSATKTDSSLPPKDLLVEKYFHPDNMSSEEKLKLELKKVRDEFKMSESDCGSSRVQIAQLTTKIKHLSSVLHKKDKHSRKGLQAMIQRRKKLLRYLRRTDWESYCFVLSKLGLRDNPDYKNL